MEDTIYKDAEPFEFRPGDRSLLLSLPNIIQSYNDFKKSKKRVVTVAQNNKSEAELKTELLSKLMKYMKSKNYDIELKSEDITEFIKSQNTARCRLRCTFCEMRIVCSFTTFWAVSNYETHFKIHIKAIEAKKAEAQRNFNRSFTRNTNESAENSANALELNKILDL